MKILIEDNDFWFEECCRLKTVWFVVKECYGEDSPRAVEIRNQYRVAARRFKQSCESLRKVTPPEWHELI